jgi:hypothetical protein
MPEPIRAETEVGLADLKSRFRAAGLSVINEHRNTGLSNSTYLAVGTPGKQTDITISDTFLNDLPRTKEYREKVESYATAVAGRLKCGSPEVFYCRSGIAVNVSIRWPIHSGVMDGQIFSTILMDVTSQADGRTAKRSMDSGLTYGRTTLDILPETVNSVRVAVDEGGVNFLKSDVYQEIFQKTERKVRFEERTQSELEKFLIGKAYVLGFLAVDEPGEIWAADPWDAQYLGATKKDLLLAMRVMRANRLFDPGSGPEYAKPTDKLLAQMSEATPKSDDLFQSQEQPTRQSLPTKDALLSDWKGVLERSPVSSLIVLDLDNFKSVNDSKGHLAGDVCLDRVVAAITRVVGRKGKLYRWGTGDEFAVLLPDFSSSEAEATAERIRAEIE